MQRYQYIPLPSQRSFRLLRITACDIKTSKVKCELQTFGTDDAPRFLTASYVWGARDETSIRAIEVAGHSIEVTANVFDFLIQTTPTDTYMWVDQICINQNDVDEREQQVSLMRDIYQRALCVQIWLGKGSSDNCPNALGDVQYINDAMQRTLGWHAFLKSSRRTRFATLREIVSQAQSYECGHSLRDHFHQLIRNPWFSRLWTMQEYVLAKEAIITVDRTIIAARMLFLVFAAIQMAGLDASQGWFTDAQSRKKFQLVVNTATIWLHCTSEDGLDLVEAQYYARYSAATDNRDTVYALLGISNVMKGVEPIRPDYRGDVLSAYRQFGLHYITRLRSLRALLLIEPAKSNHQAAGPASVSVRDRWPSWIPKPHSKSRFAREQVRNEDNHGLSAGGDNTTSILHIYDQWNLHCDGKIIDTIAAVASSPTSNDIWTQDFEDVSPENARAILQACLAITSRQKSPYSSPTDQSAEEVLGRTLCRDLRYTDTYDSFSLHEFKAWQTAIHNLENVTDPEHPSFDFNRLMIENGIYTDMRLAVTEKGSLALVPFGVQQGDQVCILIGGRVPFAIRKANAQPSNGVIVHHMISPIYVHGLMDEKAVEMIDVPCSEIILK